MGFFNRWYCFTYNWFNFMNKDKIAFNIYFGSIGKKLSVKYKFTKEFWNEELATKYAKDCATSLFYKNEGTLGIPSYDQIELESNLTGLSEEVLYEEHICDMMRWYAIPSELDTIPYNKLLWR